MSLFARKNLVRSLLQAPLTQRNAKRVPRLGMETLEDRTTPATFTVLNNLDAGVGSLRQAITDANAAMGADTIDFDPAVIGQTITIASNLPTITEAVAITGPTTGTITIDGDDKYRQFTVNATGEDVGISGLTLTKGLSALGGGALLVQDGNVTVDTVTFNKNNVNTGDVSADGGAIQAIAGNLFVKNSTFTENTSTQSGGYGSGGAIAFALNGETLTIQNSTFTNNQAQDVGGAIAATTGVVNIDGSTFTDNTITGEQLGYGGAISMYDYLGTKAQSVIITNSEFSGNTTTLDGGAISVNIGTLDVEGTTFSKNKATAATGNGGAIGLFGSAGDTNISGSTFSDNEAGSDGGGIYTTASEVTLTNSTISGNQADNGGGVGLGAAGKFTSQNSTIAFNTATTKGGGVNVPSGGVFMTTSSIIAMNSGGDVDGEAQSGGNNLFGDDTGLTITGGTDDLTNVDPKLAPLADNGGSTFTHALMNDSPALNAGSNTESLTTDQRGDGFLRVAGGVADIGAFEVQQVDTQTTLTVDTTNASFGDPVTFTATVTIADTETPAAGTVTFADANGNVLGTADLDENGVATLTLSDLLPGTTSVTASYAAADGDTFFQPSESDAVDVTITTPFPQGSSFGAGAGGGQAILQDNTGAVLQTVTPFGADFTGGVRVATADFNGDGTPDIVVGNGPGVASKVVVIDGKSGETLFEVAPFEASFTGGVFVAAGDINKDGVPELVITPDQGGGPRVQVYDGGAQFTKIADFYGITDPDFRGGARAAVADIDGDGFGDLIVSAGFEGGPRVAVWNGTTIAEDSTPEKLISDIFVFEDTLRNGAFVTGADIDGDGKAELIAGAGPGGGPRIVAFNGADLLNGQQTLVANFFAGNPDNRNGVPVGVVDYNGDGEPDLLTGTGEPLPGTMGGESTATIYAASGLSDATPTPLDSLEPFPGFTGGVFVG